MMPDPTDIRFAHEPYLRELHDELRAPWDDEVAAVVGADVDSAAVTVTALVETDMFDTQVQAYVDRLLAAGESPSPELRQRMTRAAAHGLEHQRKRSRPVALPMLLSDRRRELAVPAADVAGALTTAERDVHAYESGEVDLREVGAERIVLWGRALRVSAERMLPSLRRALEATAPARTQAAAGAERQLALRRQRRRWKEVADRLQNRSL